MIACKKSINTNAGSQGTSIYSIFMSVTMFKGYAFVFILSKSVHVLQCCIKMSSKGFETGNMFRSIQMHGKDF